MRMSSWLNGLLVSIGIPFICAGIAFVAAGLVGSKAESVKEKEDEQKLVDGASNDKIEQQKTAKKKAAAAAAAANSKDRRTKTARSVSAKHEIVDSDSVTETGDENISNEDEDDIIRLASLSHSSSGHSIAKAGNIIKRTPDITFAPISAPVDKNENDEDGWTRIPTKTEEIVGGLKQRIELLSKQLLEQEEGRNRDRAEFEGQQRKWKELDHDWRERAKALVQQVNNLENELTGLRANNQYLSEQCQTLAELEKKAEKLAVEAENCEALEGKVAQLEKQLVDAKSRHEASISVNTGLRSKLEAELESGRLEFSSMKARFDSLASENSAIQALSTDEKTHFSESLRQKDDEISLLHDKLAGISELNRNLEIDIQHMKSLTGKLISEVDETSMVSEAYSLNNQYICNLMEADQKQYQEKAKLIQELVAVRKQLKTMAV